MINTPTRETCARLHAHFEAAGLKDAYWQAIGFFRNGPAVHRDALQYRTYGHDSVPAPLADELAAMLPRGYEDEYYLYVLTADRLDDAWYGGYIDQGSGGVVVWENLYAEGHESLAALFIDVLLRALEGKHTSPEECLERFANLQKKEEA